MSTLSMKKFLKFGTLKQTQYEVSQRTPRVEMEPHEWRSRRIGVKEWWHTLVSTKGKMFYLATIEKKGVHTEPLRPKGTKSLCCFI